MTQDRTGQASVRERFENNSNGLPLTINQMLDHLQLISGNSLLNVGSMPCYRHEDTVSPLANAPALFAWINKYADVSFTRAGVNKDEFYSGICQRLPLYDWVSRTPHFPPLDGVYYTCKFPKAKRTRRFDELVDRFSPATTRDRELIRAFFLTLLWGGLSGQRPLFTFTTRMQGDPLLGTGSGKSSLAAIAAELVNGFIGIRAHSTADGMLTELLSPATLGKRLVVLDNLKTSRFSNDTIESLITSTEVNGRQLYRGHATRRNYLTWCVTVNGAGFSKDIAQRAVVIYLKRPVQQPMWRQETMRLITEHRRKIIAEIRWYLEKDSEPIDKVDRWPTWCQEVLAKLHEPNELLALIEKRRGDVDEEDEDQAVSLEYLTACIKRTYPPFDPERSWVRIPIVLMIQWIRELRTELTSRQASSYLGRLQHQNLRPGRSKSLRFYDWKGSKAKAMQTPFLLQIQTARR